MRFPAVAIPAEKMSSSDFWWTLADKGAGGAALKPCFYGFWWRPADVAGSLNGARGGDRDATECIVLYIENGVLASSDAMNSANRPISQMVRFRIPQESIRIVSLSLNVGSIRPSRHGPRVARKAQLACRRLKVEAVSLTCAPRHSAHQSRSQGQDERSLHRCLEFS